MNISEIAAQLKRDYERFPENQTYSLYTEDVRFEDPLNSFEGKERYKKMIGFLSGFFRDIQMDVHSVEESAVDEQALINTRWTLHMTAPLPWSPRLSIPGKSELEVNDEGLICSHVDYWDCSKWAVLKQVLPSSWR